MIKRIWIAAALCGLALAACSPASPTQPTEAYPSPSGSTPTEAYPSPSNPTPGGYPAPAGDPLAGTGWILTELNGQPALADVSVTLEFADGRLGGSDGCNSYGGGYRVEDGRLIVGADMASTLMACADEIMQQASAFSAVFTAIARLFN
ncbi:MAG: META domain-containing protein [Chloroflexi bacterium]|nr:META domain-containing protein [Chloroflexota bacterium]